MEVALALEVAAAGTVGVVHPLEERRLPVAHLAASRAELPRLVSAHRLQLTVLAFVPPTLALPFAEPSVPHLAWRIPQPFLLPAQHAAWQPNHAGLAPAAVAA